MADMDVGTQLAQLPVGSMVEGMGLAIAKAQRALDENTVASLQELAGTTVEIAGTKKSLIEFGLVPSFYHFTEATLDLKFSMSMSTEETKKVAFSGDLGFNQDPKKTPDPKDPIEPPKDPKDPPKDPNEPPKDPTKPPKDPEELQGSPTDAKPGKKSEIPTSKSGLAVGASLNFENTRKYGFTADGSTAMNLKLVAVPPPAALMSAIEEATEAA